MIQCTLHTTAATHLHVSAHSCTLGRDRVSATISTYMLMPVVKVFGT